MKYFVWAIRDGDYLSSHKIFDTREEAEALYAEIMERHRYERWFLGIGELRPDEKYDPPSTPASVRDLLR